MDLDGWQSRILSELDQGSSGTCSKTDPSTDSDRFERNNSGDFCIQMTSSASEELCYHPKADGPKNHAGSTIDVTQNGNKVASVFAGFTDYRICLDGVDAENDEFQFSSTR